MRLTSRVVSRNSSAAADSDVGVTVMANSQCGKPADRMTLRLLIFLVTAMVGGGPLLAPGATVAVISDPADLFSKLAAKQFEVAAPTRGLQLRFIDVRQPEELDAAFTLARRQAQAVLVVSGALTNNQRLQILDLA